MLSKYLQLMRCYQPVGTILVLLPALWALWMAVGGMPPVKWLVIFTLGAFLMRSAGCVINDYADRKLDGHVARTRMRPLPSGQVQPKEALILFGVLCFAAANLLWFLNATAIKIAVVALLLTVIYPFMKRYTQWPQLFLAAAFACAVLMAFSVVQGDAYPVDAVVVYGLYAATFLWTLMYDTIYAMADRVDDNKVGVGSTALALGRHDRWVIAIWQSGVIVLLGYIGYRQSIEWPFYLGLLGVAGLFVYQQWLIRERDPKRCCKAFLNNQWVGALILLGIILSLQTA